MVLDVPVETVKKICGLISSQRTKGQDLAVSVFEYDAQKSKCSISVGVPLEAIRYLGSVSLDEENPTHLGVRFVTQDKNLAKGVRCLFERL